MTLYQKFYKILSPTQRLQVVRILWLMNVGMLLETISFGLLIPILGFMTRVNISDEYPVFRPLLSACGNPTQAQLIIFAMVALVVLYMVKTLFLTLLAWKQNKFSSDLSSDLSSKLFIGYLRQPWTFYLQRNSAQLILNVNSEVALLISTVQSCLLLCTDVLVLFGIVILLIIVEPHETFIIIGGLGLAVFLFHRAIKNSLFSWGNGRQYHDGLRIQHLQQGFGSAKDVKLLGRENEFSLQYNFHNAHVAHITAKVRTLVDLNRLWLELFGMTGLALLVITLLVHGKSPDLLLSSMGLFAAAAFKLLPSVNRMTAALQNLRYFLPAINKIYDELQMINTKFCQQSKKLIKLKHGISINCVSYQYTGTATHALQAVSIEIQRGQSIGLIGSSGAGKSTLVDIILGLLPPDIGYIKVDGVDIQDDLRGWQDQIGYVSQSIFLTDDNIRRNVAFGVPEAEIDNLAVRRALKAAQLETFVTQLPQDMDTMVGERGVRLSGGQRQRIGIARALYHEPAVLVLDEATSSLDLETEKEVMQAVNALHGDKTIIIVAHRLSTLSNCDVLYTLENGRVIQERRVVFA